MVCCFLSFTIKLVLVNIVFICTNFIENYINIFNSFRYAASHGHHAAPSIKKSHSSSNGNLDVNGKLDAKKEKRARGSRTFEMISYE